MIIYKVKSYWKRFTLCVRNVEETHQVFYLIHIFPISICSAKWPVNPRWCLIRNNLFLCSLCICISKLIILPNSVKHFFRCWFFLLYRCFSFLFDHENFEPLLIISAYGQAKLSWPEHVYLEH